MAHNPLGRPLKYDNDQERREARNAKNQERQRNLKQIRFSNSEVVERWLYAKQVDGADSHADFARVLLDW